MAGIALAREGVGLGLGGTLAFGALPPVVFRAVCLLRVAATTGAAAST